MSSSYTRTTDREPSRTEPNSTLGPLAGLRVVALEQAVALPFATFILAELGADVIKFERPSGDVIRGWDSIVEGVSTGFVWLNAGKRDVGIDLSGVEGQTVARHIVAEADVFVENFSPGVVGRLGLSKADVERINPNIVYCSLSGFGQTGPYSNRKAYDLIVQGEAGLLVTNGTPDHPAKVGIPVTDLIGGSTAAILILAELYKKESVARYLDVSMLDAVMPWLGYYPHFVWHANQEPMRTGLRHQYTVPYGPYMAADGRYFNVAVASDNHWREFCRNVMHHPDWDQDPRFMTAELRTLNRAALERKVENVIASAPAEVWEERCEVAGIPFGSVRTIGEALSHPQITHRQMVVEADLNGHPVPLVRFPGSRPGQPRRIPGLGEHSREVLIECGFSESDIAQLIDSGTVLDGSS